MPLHKFIIIKAAYISHVVFHGVIYISENVAPSAPKVCARHHYSVQIPFPSSHTSENRPSRATAHTEWFGVVLKNLHRFTSFDSTVIRDA